MVPHSSKSDHNLQISQSTQSVCVKNNLITVKKVEVQREQHDLVNSMLY